MIGAEADQGQDKMTWPKRRQNIVVTKRNKSWTVQVGLNRDRE